MQLCWCSWYTILAACGVWVLSLETGEELRGIERRRVRKDMQKGHTLNTSYDPSITTPTSDSSASEGRPNYVMMLVSLIVTCLILLALLFVAFFVRRHTRKASVTASKVSQSPSARVGDERYGLHFNSDVQIMNDAQMSIGASSISSKNTLYGIPDIITESRHSTDGNGGTLDRGDFNSDGQLISGLARTNSGVIP